MYAYMLTCLYFNLQTWRVDSTAQSLLSTFPVSGCPVGVSSCQPSPKDPANKVEDEVIYLGLLNGLHMLSFS